MLPEDKPRDRPEDKGEEPPILRIKKDAERDVEYYYNREKRLEMPSAPRNREMKSFFSGLFSRKRRGMLSPIFPVLVAVLAMVLIFRYVVSRPSNRAQIDGYQAVLRASVYKDSVLASVSLKPGRADAGSSQDAMVRFTLPDTSEEALVSGILSGQETVLRAALPYKGVEKQIVAVVRVDGEAKKLVLAFPSPPGNPKGNP
jgi:hypothetical protein